MVPIARQGHPSASMQISERFSVRDDTSRFGLWQPAPISLEILIVSPGSARRIWSVARIALRVHTTKITMKHTTAKPTGLNLTVMKLCRSHGRPDGSIGPIRQSRGTTIALPPQSQRRRNQAQLDRCANVGGRISWPRSTETSFDCIPATVSSIRKASDNQELSAGDGEETSTNDRAHPIRTRWWSAGAIAAAGS